MPSASADLRGTAYGFFNLMSGIALLIASGVAGLLWDQFGPVFTFYAGAGFVLLPLWVLLGSQVADCVSYWAALKQN